MEKLSMVIENFSKMLVTEDCKDIQVNYWLSLEKQIEAFFKQTSNESEREKKVVEIIFKVLLKDTKVLSNKNLFYCFSSFFLLHSNLKVIFFFKARLIELIDTLLIDFNQEKSLFYDFLYDFSFTFIIELRNFSYFSSFNDENKENKERLSFLYSKSRSILLKLLYSDQLIFYKCLLEKTTFLIESLKREDTDKDYILLWKVVLDKYIEGIFTRREFFQLFELKELIDYLNISTFIIENLHIEISILLYGDKSRNGYENITYKDSIKADSLSISQKKLYFSELIMYFLRFNRTIENLIASIEYYFESDLFSFHVFKEIYRNYKSISKVNDLYHKDQNLIGKKKVIFYILSLGLYLVDEIYDNQVFNEYFTIINDLIKENKDFEVDVYSKEIVKYHNKIRLIEVFIYNILNKNHKFKYALLNHKENQLNFGNLKYNLINSTCGIEENSHSTYNECTLYGYKNISYYEYIFSLHLEYISLTNKNDNENNNIISINIQKFQKTIDIYSYIDISVIDYKFYFKSISFVLILISDFITKGYNDSTYNNLTCLFNVTTHFIDSFFKVINFFTKEKQRFEEEICYIKNSIFTNSLSLIQLLTQYYIDYTDKDNTDDCMIVNNESESESESESCLVFNSNNSLDKLILSLFKVIFIFSHEEKVCLLTTKLILHISSLKSKFNKFRSITLSLQVYISLIIHSKSLKLFGNYYNFSLEIMKNHPNLKWNVYKSFISYYKIKEIGESTQFEAFLMEKFELGINYFLFNKEFKSESLIDLSSQNENLINLLFSSYLLLIIYKDTNKEVYSQVKERLENEFISNQKYLNVVENMILYSKKLIFNEKKEGKEGDLIYFEQTFISLSTLIAHINSTVISDNKHLMNDKNKYSKPEYKSIENTCDYIVGHILDNEILNSNNELVGKLALIFIDSYLLYENNIMFYLLNHSEDLALKYISENNIEFTAVKSISNEYTKSKNKKFIQLLKGKEDYYKYYKLCKKSIKNILFFDIKHLLLEKKGQNKEKIYVLSSNLYSSKPNFSNFSEGNPLSSQTLEAYSSYFMTLFLNDLFINIKSLSDNIDIFEFLLMEDSFWKKIVYFNNFFNYEILSISFMNIIIQNKIKLDSIYSNNTQESYKNNDFLKKYFKLIQNFLSFLTSFRNVKYIFDMSLRLISNPMSIELFSLHHNKSLMFMDYLRHSQLTNDLISFIYGIIENLVMYNSYKDNCISVLKEILNSVSLNIILYSQLSYKLLTSIENSYKKNEKLKMEVVNQLENHIIKGLDTCFNELSSNINTNPLYILHINSIINDFSLSKFKVKDVFLEEFPLFDSKKKVIFKNLFKTLTKIVNSEKDTFLENYLVVNCIASKELLSITMNLLIKDEMFIGNLKGRRVKDKVLFVFLLKKESFKFRFDEFCLEECSLLLNHKDYVKFDNNNESDKERDDVRSLLMEEGVRGFLLNETVYEKYFDLVLPILKSIIK